MSTPDIKTAAGHEFRSTGDASPHRRLFTVTAGIPLLDASSLPGAVALAAQQALSGDAVLLSPACASLDMFKDYKHRAAVFVEAVAALAHEQGVELEGGL